MIHAYRETYLSKAQSVLGDAFHYAVNTCGILGSDFIKLFVASSVSKRMENGEPAYLAGKSGIEIVDEHDNLFYNVVLPEGWKVENTDRYWNHVKDQNGNTVRSSLQ